MTLSKCAFQSTIEQFILVEDIQNLRSLLQKTITALQTSSFEKALHEEDILDFEADYLQKELLQVLQSQTMERAKYYLNRLLKSLQEVKTSKINDINLNRWKEYEDILTDSLWIMDKRDNTGRHHAGYWGNFIPQIPHQLLKRYTKKGDWVLDTFLGSGTTLIECQHLGRNGIGIELQESVAYQTQTLLQQSETTHAQTIVEIGDSASINLKKVLQKHNLKNVQFVMMHPPYWDIIKFSEDKEDLSNAQTIEDFLSMFGKIIENAAQVLEKGRYLAIVIGDKYIKGEWIPLGFYCMQEAQKRGFLLKSVVVKNYEETKAKRNQKEIWRYRALVGGFYVFKHEYIFVFSKK